MKSYDEQTRCVVNLLLDGHEESLYRNPYKFNFRKFGNEQLPVGELKYFDNDK